MTKRYRPRRRTLATAGRQRSPQSPATDRVWGLDPSGTNILVWAVFVRHRRDTDDGGAVPTGAVSSHDGPYRPATWLRVLRCLFGPQRDDRPSARVERLTTRQPERPAARRGPRCARRVQRSELDGPMRRRRLFPERVLTNFNVGENVHEPGLGEALLPPPRFAHTCVHPWRWRDATQPVRLRGRSCLTRSALSCSVEIERRCGVSGASATSAGHDAAERGVQTHPRCLSARPMARSPCRPMVSRWSDRSSVGES
jgi:hypothetical protein